MKCGFYLLGEKGFFVLKGLIARKYASVVSFVVVAADGRMKQDFFEEIKHLCAQNNILAIERSKVESCPLPGANYRIAIGWRWIIPDLENLIVLHDSILPKYRGFSPLVNMLINGEHEIGVTALKAGFEYDKGEILGCEKLPISYPIKIKSAIRLISPLYLQLVLNIIEKVLNNKGLVSVPQEEGLATYSLWRGEDDYNVDWSLDASVIKRFSDAVGFPYAGSSSFLHGKKVRIYDLEVVDDVIVEQRAAHIGKVLFVSEKKPIVVCGCGLVKINEAVFEEENVSIVGKIPFRSRFCSLPKG